jgi:DNA polymerase-3 subunit alpha
MKGLERLGLLKMDFLGLTTLTVLSDTVKLIAANRGVQVDLETLPLDDAATFQLFSRGDTTAIFQFESHGMRDILRRYQPSRLEDLTALNALYRPGPIQGGMIDDFINRKHGKKKVAYDLPELQEILEETYGVILYQEQVMQIANRLAGFSLGEADILRRAMGKKNRDEMTAQREKFLTGCAVHKVPPKKAERIFDLMAEFAGYGFNKSHSCAYALLAYQTAWLKTHYAVEFMAALLTSETGNTEKVVKYIHEAKGMGITVLPPDVNTSDVDFTPVGEQIRFGMRAIKNVGENTVRGILEARQKLGQFGSIFQVCDSVDARLLNRRVLESLVKAGALDSFGARRAQLYAAIDRAMERGQKIQRDSASSQHGLFMAGDASHQPPEPQLPDAEEWPEYELLANEFATLGFYISGHPLDKYSARLRELKAVELAAMEGRRNGEDVVIGALVSSLRPMRSRKGDRWAILNLQDMTGELEALVFPEAFARLEAVLKSAVPLLLRGRVNVEDAGTRVAIQEARPLDGIAGAPETTARMRVRIDLSAMDEYTLDQIKTVLAGSPGPCPIAFDIFDPDGSMATIASNQRVRIDERLVNRLQEMPGVGAVEVVR